MNFAMNYTPSMINAIRAYRIHRGLGETINPFIPFTQEQWKPIVIPDIDPNAYQISSFGRVYSNMTRQFLLPNNRGGYQHVVLMTIDDRRVAYAVHRLVAMTYILHYDLTKNLVNHIDGDPSNNAVWNLEWVSAQENSNHAYRIGLCQPRALASLKENEIHEVCKMLEKGISFDEIANSLLPAHPNQSVMSLRMRIARIARHQTDVEISSQYNIDHNNNHSTQNMTLDDIHQLCILLQKGTSLDEIMETFDIPDTMRVWLKDFISKLMNKKVFADISAQYTGLKYPEGMQPKKHRLTPDQEDQIVSLLKMGKHSNEIFFALFGKSWKEIPLNDYYSFKTAIQNVKKRRAGELS